MIFYNQKIPEYQLMTEIMTMSMNLQRLVHIMNRIAVSLEKKAGEDPIAHVNPSEIAPRWQIDWISKQEKSEDTSNQ